MIPTLLESGVLAFFFILKSELKSFSDRNSKGSNFLRCLL
nr:MAG TPA: hypothetical protein [Myoviridae sp. ctTS62]